MSCKSSGPLAHLLRPVKGGFCWLQVGSPTHCQQPTSGSLPLPGVGRCPRRVRLRCQARLEVRPLRYLQAPVSRPLPLHDGAWGTKSRPAAACVNPLQLHTSDLHGNVSANARAWRCLGQRCVPSCCSVELMSADLHGHMCLQSRRAKGLLWSRATFRAP